MVAAPSPTAEATQVTDPRRTSPAANTPGRLVSSGNGGRPGGQRLPAGRFGAGEDEPPPVAGDGLAEPVRPRPGADQDEQGVRGDAAPRPRDGVLQYQRLEVACAGTVGDLHAVADVDVRGRADFADEVVRHARGQR